MNRCLHLVLLAACFALLGAPGSSRAEELQATPAAKRHGTPGPNKILVIVKGSVLLKGEFFIDAGTTLLALPQLVGGYRICASCGDIPKADANAKADYSTRNVKKLETVVLHDGDTVDFVHFTL